MIYIELLRLLLRLFFFVIFCNEYWMIIDLYTSKFWNSKKIFLFTIFLFTVINFVFKNNQIIMVFEIMFSFYTFWLDILG